MLILTTLAHAKTLHGFAIAERIEQLSEDVLRVEEGSLYPALQRLLLEGWIADDWGRTSEIVARATTRSPRQDGGNSNAS